MMIIGIDPGVKNIGIAYIEDCETKLITITSKQHLFGRSAMFEMCDRAIDYLTKVLNVPDIIVVIEDYAPAGFFNVLEAEVVGVLLHFFYTLRHITIHLIKPSTAKKCVTGDGFATKDKVKEALLRKYPSIKDKDDHAIDALAMLDTYMSYSVTGGVSENVSRMISGNKLLF